MGYQDQTGDLFEKYLLNQLSEKEREELEEQLENNPDMMHSLNNQIDLMKGAEAFGQAQMKKELSQMEKELYKQESPARSRYLRPLLAAASVALLVLALSWFYQSSSTSNAELYANYYQAYSLNTDIRSTDAPANLQELNKVYGEANYAQALTILNELLRQQPDQSVWLLAAANCQLESDNPLMALPYLDNIIDRNDPFYQDKAIWYKALTYLKIGSIQQAKVQLNALVANEGADYRKEAIELLKEL